MIFIKIYTCICGRTFDKPNSFNGHKSHCKANLESKGKLDVYKKRQTIQRNNCAKGRETQKTNSQVRKETELNQWLSEKHVCENCGKVMTEKFATGRFCSRSCANTKEHTEEMNRKTSATLKSHFEYVEYNGEMMTRNAFDRCKMGEVKKIERRNSLNDKHKSLCEELDIKNSPYSEYNRVYLNQGAGDCYVFVQVNEETLEEVKRITVPYYRYMVEKDLGRKLEYDEVVHHIDGNHFNNVLDNLMVLTRSEHSSLHNHI